MNILFLEQFSELGGGQRNLLDLLPAVLDRGWKATVAAPASAQGPGALFERARDLGAETARIALGNYSVGRKTPADAARFVVDTIALGRWIARQQCDLISAGGARLMPAVARGAHDRPVIFQAQHFLGKSYAVSTTARAIRSANATVIANCEHVASQFRGAVENIRVVYNGVAEIPFTERRERTCKKIGVIGRIAPMKGQADFLRASALIHRELPEIKFLICGSPMFTAQSYVNEVNRLARNLPVEFLGWRDDVGEVLGDLDLLIAPSTTAEATTRVILEAFSAGVPVVAYAIGGIPEIVRDGDNGFLAPECRPEALALKIMEVLNVDLSAVAGRARADWERNYTVGRYREQIVKIIAASETTTASLRTMSG